MELNWVVFPAPYPPTYLSDEDINAEGRLIYIPTESIAKPTDEEDKAIESPVKLSFISSRGIGKHKGFPWYYIPFKEGSSKIIMYFHGNAEDVGQSSQLMTKLSLAFKWHIICLEYPGYGVCFRENKNTAVIVSRAMRTYEFLTKEYGYEDKDIIIFGRSVGSGPAVDLASKTNPCALILMSAYTSLK